MNYHRSKKDVLGAAVLRAFCFTLVQYFCRIISRFSHWKTLGIAVDALVSFLFFLCIKIDMVMCRFLWVSILGLALTYAFSIVLVIVDQLL